MSIWTPMWDKVLDANPIADAIALDLDYRSERYRALDNGILVEKPWADIVNNYSAPAGRTYFDSSGVLQTAAANEMIRAFDPATGELLGNQIWGAYENKFNYSDDFSRPEWTKNGSYTVIAALSVPAPDGSNKTFKLVAPAGADPAAANGGGMQRASSFPGDHFQTYFVKAAEINSVNLRNNVNGQIITISLVTGTVSGGAEQSRFVVRKCADGWFRIGMTVLNGENASRYSIRGNGVATGTSGIYIFRGEITAGTAMAPSVGNPGATTTPIAAESQIIDGSVFSDIWNPAGGTLFIECSGAINAVALKAAGIEVVVDSVSNKKYAVAYTSDPSATSLIIGANLNGYIRRIVYFRKELPASLIARLIA